MKTTGVSGIPKFGLFDFLGHPSGQGQVRSVMLYFNMFSQRQRAFPFLHSLSISSLPGSSGLRKPANHQISINHCILGSLLRGSGDGERRKISPKRAKMFFLNKVKQGTNRARNGPKRAKTRLKG